MGKDRIWIVPDVHCRDFYKPILQIKDESVIFLGDYMDPYKREGFTDEHGIENLEEIIEHARNNANVTLLVGNHCLSWIWGAFGWERTSYEYYPILHRLYRDNIDLFKPCKLIKNVLFTHAGVSGSWVNHINDISEYKGSEFRLTQDNVVSYIETEFASSLNQQPVRHLGEIYLESPIFNVGYARGGYGYGGPFWNDFHAEYSGPKGWSFKQCFGHTQTSVTGFVRQDNTGTCLDSRAIFEMDLNTGEIIFSELNDEKTKAQRECI